MFSRLSTFLLFIVSLGLLAAHAATLNVGPGQTYTTIQSGIDAAANGDTVVVAPGTYYENIDFKGKAITVSSAMGAASTTIDGSSAGPAVTFKSGEPRAAVLSGFTILHGGSYGAWPGLYVSPPGAVVVLDGAPTILDNVITQSTCWGILDDESAPLIKGNEISATQDPHGQCGFGGGAGIYVGGDLNRGISNYQPAIIFGNTIEDNVQSGNEDAGGNGGAGIAVWGGSPVIQNNIIRNNDSPGGSGGAINVEYGKGVTIVQNLIYGNKAECGGGAIAFQLGSEGSGIDILIANNTIVNNTGVGTAGFSECTSISQIYPAPDSYGSSGPTAVIVNNILSGSTSYPAVNCAQYAAPTEEFQPVFDHNVLINEGGAFFGTNCVDVSAKYGNLKADPQFVNVAGDDYHLKPTSPAIDAGNNSVLASIVQLNHMPLVKDLDGNPRQQDFTGKGYPVIDIGAYEAGGLVNASPTAIVLTSSAYFGTAGSNYSLTASLSSAAGIPSGTVTFFMDGTQAGTGLIDATGTATLSNFAFVPGVHSLYATYPGQSPYTPAISVVIIVDISQYSTTITATSSPNPSLVGQAVLFTVNVSSADPTSVPSPVKLVDSGSNTVLATLLPNSAGTATFSTSSLTLGDHFINVSYDGDSTHAPGETSVDQDVVTGYPTNVALSSSVNPSTIHQPVTFVAQITGSGAGVGAPTGSVVFLDGTATLSTQPLLAGAAQATYTTSALSAGTHTITATYQPTGAFAGASASLTQVVNANPATARLTVSPGTALVGAPVTLTAVVASVAQPGYGTPSGTVTFLNGAASVGSASLANGVASITLLNLPGGVDALTCQYSGDANYSASACNVVPTTIQAIASTLTLTANANPVAALLPVTLRAQLSAAQFRAGNTIQFGYSPDGSARVVATAVTDATGVAKYTTQPLRAGTHAVSASFAGNNDLRASSASLAEVVNANPTLTVLTAAPNPAYQGQTVQVSVGVSTAAGVVPAGPVTLLDGTAVLGTATLAGGQGTFALSTLLPGKHVLTAEFGGDQNNLASASAAVTETVLPNGFTLSSKTTALTVRTEHHITFTVEAASIGVFADQLQMTGVNLPPHVTLQFRPNPMALAKGGSGSISVYLDTDDVIGFRSALAMPEMPGAAVGGALGLAFVPWLTLAAFGRRRRRVRLPLLLSVVCATALMVLSAGCGDKYPGATAPGNYSIQISATGAATGMTHTLTIPLVVTK